MRLEWTALLQSMYSFSERDLSTRTCLRFLTKSHTALLQSMLCGMCSVGSNFSVRDALRVSTSEKEHCSEHAQKRLVVIMFIQNDHIQHAQVSYIYIYIYIKHCRARASPSKESRSAKLQIINE